MKLKYLSIIIFVIGMGTLLWQTYQNPIVKNKFPIIDRFIKGIKYQQLSKKYTPSSVQAKRLKAISDALKHNKTDYQFHTGPLTVSGK